MSVLTEPYTTYGIPTISKPQWSSLVGIITAIVGNILISFALNTQRYAHIRISREYKDRQDPDAKEARKHLPKKLRNYGTAVQQEAAAEERQRINEEAEVPSDLNSHHSDHQDAKVNGKSHATDDAAQDGQAEDEKEEEDHGRPSYLKSPYWWAGIIMMTIGEAGNFLAYGFAPASIVSPLGVVALVSNCLIAPLMLKERFRQRDLWGVLIAIGGAVTVVLSAKTSEKKLGPDSLWADIKRWEFLVYVLITTLFIVALMFTSPNYGQRTISIDLGLVGLFGGYTALSTKGVASLLSTSLYKAFKYPILYVLILILVTSAIMQIRYLNRALQNFDSTQVIPVQFVLFTLSVIIGSAVLYRDFERTDVDHVLKFIFGCLLTFSGVYLITSGRKQEDEDEHEEEDHDAEQIHLLDEESTNETTLPIKQERDLRVDTNFDEETSPTLHPPLSSRSSNVPSIAVTPAASADDLDKNPWLSSTDRLVRAQTQDSNRPRTPPHQTLTPGSSSHTPFFTPHSTQRNGRPADRLDRSISSPAQPQTPTRRTASPPRPSIEDAKRGSISRLLPGPILQPLSSSLSGIVADRILRGEGTPSPTRGNLRRNKSNRESARLRAAAAGTSDTDLEAGLPSAFASETSIQRSRDARRAQSTADGEVSPLLFRTRTSEEGLGASLGRARLRLRGMSETFTNLVTGRRGSKDESADDNDGSETPTAQSAR